MNEPLLRQLREVPTIQQFLQFNIPIPDTWVHLAIQPYLTSYVFIKIQSLVFRLEKVNMAQSPQPTM